MLKNKFKNSLKRGTGETILILQDNPQLDFSEMIINASINNLAYDPQCEGGREDYLYELIELSPNKEKIKKNIIEKLSTAKNAGWGTYQLFELAKLFAKNGNKNARKSIYARYAKNLRKEYEFINTLIPIDLDGFEGLKFIAKINGKKLIEDVNAGENDYIFSYAEELYPGNDFEKKLEQEAEKNKFIKTFLNEIKSIKKKKQTNKSKKYNYKYVFELIKKNEKILSFIGRKLSNEDLIKLANNLKKENDKYKILNYLKLFSSVKFPHEWQTLYGFLKLNNKEITTQIIKGLKYFKSDEIRDLAIKQLNTKNFDEEYLDLLIENYINGDHKLISKLLKSTKNPHKFHRLCGSVLSIYEKNKTKECIEPLEIFYNKSFCGLCRKDAVEIMIKNKVLPEYIKLECLFDSNIEIRELIKNSNEY